MKKVLIITYYWPPGGGAGVQRWLKFVKYLNQFGWEPIVYTPSNGEMPVLDASLEKDIPPGTQIVKQPIWEPYSLYKKFIGQKKDERVNAGFISENKKRGFTQKISIWIRGNFFIPDARVFWVKPSVHFLNNYLKTHPVEAMISTGPPHSMHLIALGLKNTWNIPWIADFRDPWTNIDFYDQLMLSSWADAKHHRLEQQVILKADRIISVGRGMMEELKDIYLKIPGVSNLALKDKFINITNGFDETDISSSPVVLDEDFSIAHIGSMNTDRNPKILWEVLSELVKENQAFAGKLKIKLIGKTDINIIDDIEANGLHNFLQRTAYLPHDQIIQEQQKVQVLLLVINNTPNAKGILTGKFFEYLAAKRPILCIGPKDGEIAEIIKDTQAGSVIDYNDKNELKVLLMEYFHLFQQKELDGGNKNIEQFSRRELTRKLVTILDNMMTTK